MFKKLTDRPVLSSKTNRVQKLDTNAEASKGAKVFFDWEDAARDWHAAMFGVPTRFMDVISGLCPEEIYVLQQACYEQMPDYIIEIGRWRGSSTLAFASACKVMGKGRVVSIDPLSRDSIKVPFDLEEYITFIDATSAAAFEEVSRLVPRHSNAILFHDSVHTYEHTKADIALYESFLGYGSRLLIHDTDNPGDPRIFSNHRLLECLDAVYDFVPDPIACSSGALMRSGILRRRLSGRMSSHEAVDLRRLPPAIADVDRGRFRMVGLDDSSIVKLRWALERGARVIVESGFQNLWIANEIALLESKHRGRMTVCFRLDQSRPNLMKPLGLAMLLRRHGVSVSCVSNGFREEDLHEFESIGCHVFCET